MPEVSLKNVDEFNNILNIEELYKNEIDSIWRDENFKLVPFFDRGYAIQKHITHDAILFIGINPSFNEKRSSKEKNFFYVNHEQKEVYQYFKKFQDISQKTGIEWSHHDLLHIRQTDQREVRNLFNDAVSKTFLSKQLMISRAIIENAKPKMIVISNAYARDLFLNECNIETVFDYQIGTHRIINNNKLEGTPVFFTSMLTGQRALDNGSYERLIWHINQVLK